MNKGKHHELKLQIDRFRKSIEKVKAEERKSSSRLRLHQVQKECEKIDYQKFLELDLTYRNTEAQFEEQQQLLFSK